jgi:hypothetical protein
MMSDHRAGFVPFVVAFFTKDFFLGDTHNAVEGKVISDSQEALIIPSDQETAGASQAAPVDDRGRNVKRRAQSD